MRSRGARYSNNGRCESELKPQKGVWGVWGWGSRDLWPPAGRLSRRVPGNRQEGAPHSALKWPNRIGRRRFAVGVITWFRFSRSSRKKGFANRIPLKSAHRNR